MRAVLYQKPTCALPKKKEQKLQDPKGDLMFFLCSDIWQLFYIDSKLDKREGKGMYKSGPIFLCIV